MYPAWGQDTNLEAGFWQKYGGMPPLDIRINLNDKPAKGLFESAREQKTTGKDIPLNDILISAVVGQKIKYKVEISPRDKEQWVDVTRHRGLDIFAPGQQVEIDPSKSELRMVSDSRYPTANPGIQAVSFYYYAARTPQDEEMAFTKIYFDVQLKDSK